MSRVRCTHCGSIYDLTQGKSIARYADCDVFETPCCHRQVDTRQWKSFPDYERIQPGELSRRGKGYVDEMGRFVKVLR